MVQIAAPVIITSVSACIFVFVAFTMGLFTYVTPGVNQCEMTYMFEYPQYIPVPLPPMVAAQYPKYHLYLYGEGNYARQLERGHIHGIPVIFIAGNAGCNKQVRSLASVAYRMHEDLHKLHHFNYYTVDFNEEFSGLYGGVLYTQSEYLRQAVLHVQSLYSKPTKVILIGHSMGGLVAKSVFTDPLFPSTAVDLVITLATPHNAAPYTLDWHINSFYRDWTRYSTAYPAVYKDKVFVSISGGARDKMIQAHQTVIQNDNVVNVVAHHVPTVQVSPDHLQVVWCRQLVKVLCKSMFDLIDPSTLTLTADIGRVRNVFRRDLLGGGEKMSPGALPTKSGVATVTVTESSFSRTVRGRDGWQKFVIEETANVGKEANLVLHNPPKSPWLYHCVNTECVDITSHCTQYLSEGGVIYHYSKVLSEGSVVVFLNAGHSKAKESSVFVDVIEKGSNVKGVELLQHTAQYSNSLVQVIEITAMREDYWISGRVQVTAGKCDVLKSRVKFPVSLFQHSFEDKYSISSEGKLDTVIQKLTLNDPSAPRVVLLLDPHCEYGVELTVDTTETAANLIRFQYHLLLPALLCVMLGVSSNHLSALPGSVKSDFLTFIEEISNIYTCALLVGVKCLTWLLPTLVPSLQAHISFLPNFLTLRTEILIITLLTCFVMCFILSSLCRVVCWGIGCVLRRTKLVVSSSPVFFNYKFQGILLILGTLTTGSLVLIINVILLLISTCSIPPSSAARHQLSFTFLLFNFIGMLTGIPTFASWVKNLTVGVLWLEHDTSYIFALVSSLSVVLFYKHPANNMNSFQRCAHVMRMMKYLTLTCLFTYPHIVPWVYFAVILMIASSHFLRSISLKKDS